MKPPPYRINPAVVALGLAALVTLLIAGVVRLGALEGAEFQGYDLLVATHDLESPAAELLFLDFDDSAMQAWGVSRIPRDKLAQVLAVAAAGGAEIIALDVLLDEKRGADEDAALARAIGDAGNVVLASIAGVEQLPASEPLPPFRERALATGFVNLPVDSDGFLRRMLLWVRTPEYAGESFPVAVATNYLQRPLERGRPGTYRLGANEIHAAPDAANTALIGAWSAEPVRTVPVLQFLATGFDRDRVKGKIVLVGQSSAKGKDRYPTPQFRFSEAGAGHRMLPGTEIHAAAVSSLLHGRTIRKLSAGPHWALSFLLVALVVLCVVCRRVAVGLGAAFAGLLIAYLLARGLFARGVWMPFLSTEAAVVLALPAGLGYRYLEERRLKAESEAERQELMGLFSRYVSPEVASEIWERRGEIVLAGQEKTATILFSDIRGFTQLTAGRPSAEVLAWLNEYLTAMDEIIRRNGGFLNKFIGDGIMVLFGVPLSTDAQTDACRAVTTALEMLERVEELNQRHGGDGRYPQLRIGVGIHTGTVTAGNVGSLNRLEYSVIGEAVNLASRLESLTKEFKALIVMSPETRALVEDRFETQPLGKTLVRGFSGEIQVYTATRPVAAEVRP
jgi:adenylate cyclase